jgi:hypothetical protein
METNMTNEINTYAADYFNACVKTEQALAKRMTKAISASPDMIREIAQAVAYADADSVVFCEKKKAEKTDMKLRRKLYAETGVGDLSYLLERSCRNDLKAFRKIGEKSPTWSQGFILAVCDHTAAKGAHGLVQASEALFKAIEKEYLADAPTESDSTSESESEAETDAAPEIKANDLGDIATKLIGQLGKKEAYKLSVILGDMSQDELTDAELEAAVS